MKMMEEKEKCFDDCKEQKKSYYEDHCKPRKYYYDDDDYEPRKSYYDDCYEPKKCYYEKEYKPKKRCYEECYVVKKPCKCSPEPGKALLKCGCGTAGPLPILGTAGLIPTTPIPVGSVSIDTTELCNPSVLITFTAIINTPISVLSSLSFRIVRCIDGCSQHVGGSYTFSNAVNALSSDSFTFQYCDCSQCCGCATYSIEISNATLLEVGTTVNATISALAVENNC